MSSDVSRIAHLFLSNLDSSAQSLTVRALLAEHLAEPAAAIRRTVHHSARQLGSVALLEFHRPQVSLRLFTTSDATSRDHRQRAVALEAEHLSGALADLPGQTSLLLLVPDCADSPLLEQCHQISVVASPDSPTMVTAYRQLKKLRPNRADVLGLTLVDCLSFAQGQRIAERLRQTTQEFLDTPLRLDAIVLRNSRLRERKLAQVRSVEERVLSEGIALLYRRDG
ncbi:MAG: hypothetical protein GWP14_03985 [Actinobacteria bacterium]|nr:hypothetical protein [Actinomycetota bacterium]